MRAGSRGKREWRLLYRLAFLRNAGAMAGVQLVAELIWLFWPNPRKGKISIESLIPCL